ncbi:hypothetical protein ITJ86_11535 [Winogradskyella sp. F6397]|uniref:Uncharacterized protein n=1 Tax=Winogradskyella marina TaxID=2785530 RepID=A0ABS0EJ88_9FLAO|nr:MULTISPECIES: DUF6452 family protein [Winogradskyella]MBF8150533.1 hypothetical protein [Winogradskyella marina]
MKRLLIFLSFITLAITNYNCERDDICAATTQTTPRLIIEFYDASDPEELLNVPRITVYGDGLLEEDDDGNPIEPIVASDVTLNFNENINIIELPLVVGAENELITTRFILERDTNLRLDDDPLTASNIDIIEVSYETEFVYVSRACGYKSIFKNVIVRRITDSDQWITNIQNEDPLEPTVENENTTHVRIYH